MSLPQSSRLSRRRNFFRRLRLYAYISGVLLLFVGLGYAIIGSSLFTIGETSVNSAGLINESALLASLRAQVAARPLGWLGTNNYLAWPTDLEYKAPAIKTIKIEKSFWGKDLKISVIPRERYAVWCTGETNCSWVDREGVLFEPAPIAEGQLVQTIFENSTSSAPILGTPVLTSSSFGIIAKTIEEMRRLNISVTTLTVNRSLQELELHTSAGADIIISLRFDPEKTALPTLQRFSEKPGLQKIEYINLTVENRAYVKYR